MSDPIEVRAIGAIARAWARLERCRLGSVTPAMNLGVVTTMFFESPTADKEFILWQLECFGNIPEDVVFAPSVVVGAMLRRVQVYVEIKQLYRQLDPATGSYQEDRARIGHAIRLAMEADRAEWQVLGAIH